jgi:large subunit ribosomal protein L28
VEHAAILCHYAHAGFLQRYNNRKTLIRKGGSIKLSGQCDICGKVPTSGHNVSFSHRVTNRKWRPNIQHARLSINGQVRKVNICTRCLRTLQKPPTKKEAAARA